MWIVADATDDPYFFEQGFKTRVPSLIIRWLYEGEELLPALEQSETYPDLNRPRVNGFNGLAQLGTDPLVKDLPVVVLSTSSEEPDRPLQLGANGFLTKPPTLDQLLSLFGTLVEEWPLG